MKKRLEQLTPRELGKLFPIILTKHNPRWSRLYLKEKSNLEKILGTANVVRIEHIGSTAIKGLVSKPTIDILLEVPESSDLQQVIDKITGFNYHYIPQPDKPPPQMMFVKGYTDKGFKGQAFHIHVRYPGDWDEIRFRDYLLEHRDIAGQYGKLKLKLAQIYVNDRDGYTRAKTEFIENITNIARQEKDRRNC